MNGRQANPATREHRMNGSNRVWPILLTSVSALFAALLFVGTVDEHGVAMSLAYCAIGVAFLWLTYYFFLRSAVEALFGKRSKDSSSGSA